MKASEVERREGEAPPGSAGGGGWSLPSIVAALNAIQIAEELIAAAR